MECGHILLLCHPAWGHLRPLASFAAKLVQERPDVSVTYLTLGDFTPRVEGEIDRYFSTSEKDSRAKANIRVFNLGGKGTNPFELLPTIVPGFTGFYNKLIRGESMTCFATQKAYLSAKPNVVVLDFFLLDVLRVIRSVTGKSIPVHCWVSPSAAPILSITAPAKFGGLGDVASEAPKVAEATGRSLDDVLQEMYHPQTGAVVNVAGLPPMYDYEWYCQEFTPEIPQNLIWASGTTFLHECDGIVSISSAVIEKESIDAFISWFGETNRPVYAVGPLVPPESEIAKQNDIEGSANGKDILAFLDKTLKSHGPRSLIYVSWGSLWWPKKHEHVWIMVDVLLELGVPFILSHAPPQAIVPPGYHDKIKQSGTGLLATWSPQQTILSHEATGWILSHCGHNSVTEALAQGIPIIGWPLDADQPLNAQNLTLRLDVAFELVEVRTGYGLKPLYRGARPTGTVEAVAAEARDILKRARGQEGERKRRNAEDIRDKWKEEWKEGGQALNNLRKFVSDHCSGAA